MVLNNSFYENAQKNKFKYPAIICYSLKKGDYVGQILDIISLDEFIDPVKYRKHNTIFVKKRYVNMLEKGLKNISLGTKEHENKLNEIQKRLSKKETYALKKQNLGPSS